MKLCTPDNGGLKLLNATGLNQYYKYINTIYGESRKVGI